MVKRNPCFAQLNSGYLFPEINKRKRAYLEKNPTAQLISLGIGDTTEPLTPHITAGLSHFAKRLGTLEGYSGYGLEQGQPELRQKLAETLYKSRLSPQDIFISDGAKCDIGRLQLLFGSHCTIAVQDPAYPVYVDSSLMIGQPPIVYMRCAPENDFFPDLATVPKTDLIYFCSPNNPTGTVATREQLEQLVSFAKANHSILIFDAAYAIYISDPSLPKSIYEIEGAEEVAIELGSFSKMAGFTGVRLAWSVVPESLRFDDGTPVKRDWSRTVSTIFNGASNIAQAGGLAALEPAGQAEMHRLIAFYMENAKIIKSTFEELGYKTYGGTNAPYLWVDFGEASSWDMFDQLLHHMQIVSTPGSGFGPAGEGFLRFSAFGHRAHILETCRRIQTKSVIINNH